MERGICENFFAELSLWDESAPLPFRRCESSSCVLHIKANEASTESW